MAVGTAMDMTPTILILTPVLMPVVKAAGIDPVYFGVLFIINNAIGLVTPPVGTVLNTVAGVGRMKMDDVTRGVRAVHVRRVRGHVPDGALSAAGHRARQVVRRLMPLSARPRYASRHNPKETIDETFDAAAIARGRRRIRTGRRAAQAQDKTFKLALQNPKGHPLAIGASKFAELVASQDRRQDQGQRLPRRHAGRRCAQRVGRAGRHASNSCC